MGFRVPAKRLLLNLRQRLLVLRASGLTEDAFHIPSVMVQVGNFGVADSLGIAVLDRVIVAVPFRSFV